MTGAADVEGLIERLETTAAMIELGEKIAWGSDTAVMREASAMLRALSQALAAAELRADKLESAALEVVRMYWIASFGTPGPFGVQPYDPLRALAKALGVSTLDEAARRARTLSTPTEEAKRG